jgi:hypothetical protein
VLGGRWVRVGEREVGGGRGKRLSGGFREEQSEGYLRF